ncbi:MAG: periplasmic heavy metal sensor, partial [Spirochaetes bacterium]|nr:periplasmic heavy metal sensor [Spirochaetota bacterium]
MTVFEADRLLRCQTQEKGYFCNSIPSLTQEQEQEITKLRTAHMKEMNNFRNNLAIKRAELRKLQTADKADMDAINNTIDEIGTIRTKMAKIRAAHI